MRQKGTREQKIPKRNALKGRDGREDLTERDEEVDRGLEPNVDVCDEGVVVCVVARGGLVSTRRLLVDERLEQRSAHHGQTSHHEAPD